MKTLINAIWWWGGIIAHSVWYSRTYDVSGWELVTEFSLKWILTLLPVLAFIAVGQFISMRIYSNILLSSDVNSLDNEEADTLLQAVADAVNQSCPKAIDEHTRVISAIAGPGRKFTYNYTITGVEKSDEDSFINTMRPKLIEGYKSSDDMETFRQLDTEINWVYNLENGEEFARIKIWPEELL